MRTAVRALLAYPARHQFVHALWRIVDARPDDVSVEHLAKGGGADQRFQTLIKAIVDKGSD